MNTVMRALDEFHKRFKYPRCPFKKRRTGGKERVHLDRRLAELAVYCETWASKMEKFATDDLKDGFGMAYRIHLITEEVGELVRAHLDNNEVAALDATVDLIYVLAGTAWTFGWPLEEAFLEVHRSNMSKKPRDEKEDPRMRDKGPDYSPPDIETILERSRVDGLFNDS